MKHKKLFISLTAVLAVFVFLGIFIFFWFVGDSYEDFEKFRKEFAIEGLDDGAVPQGLAEYYADYQEVGEDGKTVTKKQHYFLTSAYMTDGSPSRIYVRGSVSGYIGYVTMENIDGTLHTGHVGGIATNSSRLWLTDGDSVLVAKASKEYENQNILREIVDKAAKNSELKKGEERLTIKFTASFKTNGKAAYLYYFHDPRYTTTSYDRLYVGEFYRSGNYETDKTHHATTPEGYKNTSFMYEYRVDYNSSNEYGLYVINQDKVKLVDANGENVDVPQIQKIYSLPEKIQGVAFSGRASYGTSNGTLILSQSYGLANSHILCFDWNQVNTAKNNSKKYLTLAKNSFAYNGVYTVNPSTGKNNPYTDPDLIVYFVDMNNKEMLLNDYSVPSMSEGMCTVTIQGSGNNPQDRVYVLFESGSKKYSAFTRRSMKNVYSFIPKTVFA